MCERGKENERGLRPLSLRTPLCGAAYGKTPLNPSFGCAQDRLYKRRKQKKAKEKPKASYAGNKQVRVIPRGIIACVKLL